MKKFIRRSDGIDPRRNQFMEKDYLIDHIIRGMSSKEKAAQLIMPAFRQYTDGEGIRHDVEHVYPEMKDLLSSYSFAGIMLFAMNLKTAEKAFDLIREIKDVQDPDKPGLLLALDQEGGVVSRIGTGTPMPGNMALGAGGDCGLTRRAASVIGSEIASIGANMDAAPVVDINDNPQNPVIGVRSFSDDPDTVSKHGKAYLEGLAESHIIGTLKHYPGHGNTETDSHTGLPCVNKTLEDLKKTELRPYADLIPAGVEMIMTAHIQFPQVEKETYLSKKTGEPICLPATVSKVFLTDILRQQLGYEGVVITDSMGMDAISSHFDPLDAAKLAIEAGVDILLMPVDTAQKNGIGKLKEYIHTIAKAIDEGFILQQCVDQALARILTLKCRHGLCPGQRHHEKTAALASVGCKAHRELEWQIASDCVTLVKGREALPLDPNRKTLIMTPFSSEINAARLGLFRAGVKMEQVLFWSADTDSPEGLFEKMKKAEQLIIVSATYKLASLNADDPYYRAAQEAMAWALKNDVKTVFVSAQLPYDIPSYSDADVQLAVYCAKGMSEDPRFADNGVMQYNVNLPVAFFKIFTKGEKYKGSLPVRI
ncbi:MAG: hypothetical protein II710_07090 [Clostridia bacterium]|nr:hypothetical protein [Clostridia bacterium]